MIILHVYYCAKASDDFFIICHGKELTPYILCTHFRVLFIVPVTTSYIPSGSIFNSPTPRFTKTLMKDKAYNIWSSFLLDQDKDIKARLQRHANKS